MKLQCFARSTRLRQLRQPPRGPSHGALQRVALESFDHFDGELETFLFSGFFSPCPPRKSAADRSRGVCHRCEGVPLS